jgi:hypothetical protein
MRHRNAVAAVLVLLVTTAGCVGSPNGASPESSDTTTDPSEPPDTTTAPPASSDTPTEPSKPSDTPTAPPAPSGTIDVSDGPKEPPERPPTLNESSVREYVRSYEYRIAYNSLWVNENTTVTLDCRVDDVTERPWGAQAVVTCTGSSKTNGLNADWFTQT